MNKYFYPIYKMKIPPWIKYWLLKKTSGSKVLSELIEGTSPITIENVYKGTSLQELVFKGQTIQDGTPTPEAPIEVETVSGDNNIVVSNNNLESSYRVDLGGKNILNLNATQTKSGVTCTNNGDGSITLNGTATANIDLWIANGSNVNVVFKSMPNGTSLTQSINAVSGSYTGTVYLETVTYNGSTNNYTNLRNNNSYTFTYDGWIKCTEIFISNGSVFNNWTIKPQLEYGSQATPYSPYTENPIELCKIGDYQDRIYYDSGKWYIEKKVNKVIFNGSENWTRTTRPDGNVFWNYYDLLNVPKPYLNSSVIKICNYFPYEFKTWGDVSVNCMGENGLFNVNSPSFLFRISTNILSTLEEWKTWLSTHNIIVYYILAEATTTEITNTNLIEQLETIKNATLISGTNKITQLPADLPFILNFKYYMKG